jgi:osmotically-inducible protein OsmY
MNRAPRIITLASMLALTALIGACAQTRTSDSTGQYIDDATITTKVKTAILGDSELKVMQIAVTTDKDSVILTGTVDSPHAAAHAGYVARQVAGVTSVQNNLVVR